MKETILNPWQENGTFSMIVQTQIMIEKIYNTEIIGHQVTQVAFKNCAPFTKCITKVDETTIDDAED